MAEDENVERIREFWAWLRDHRGGELSDELGEATAEVLLAVSATGKSGSLTLTVKFESKGRSVLVVDEVKTKVPKPDREAAIYFADAEGNLVRDDPVQTKLNFEVVERVSGEQATVDRKTGELVSLPTGNQVAVNDGTAPEPDEGDTEDE